MTDEPVLEQPSATDPAAGKEKHAWSFRRTLDNIRRLNGQDRLLLSETIIVLAASSVAIKLLPFRIISRAVSLRRGQATPPEKTKNAHLKNIRWAVELCGARLPWRIVCFQKGVALHMMLRRRGIDSRLHYGVALNPERGLAAHVWVTAEGKAIIGGEVAADYTCLATYPSF